MKDMDVLKIIFCKYRGNSYQSNLANTYLNVLCQAGLLEQGKSKSEHILYLVEELS